MTTGPANRTELLDVFAGIAGEFDQIKRQIERRETDLKRELDKLEVARKASPWSQSPLEAGHPLLEIATHCQSGLDATLAEWIKNVNNYDRHTRFRQGFDDSLLIFVYGKVKAGKSSLGNYLAYGHSKPDQDSIRRASPPPSFFCYESTDASETMSDARIKENGCFGVDVVEATSSIQGFTLPGMTWVDSPGVHSMTTANGQLTNDYVACADLIVFLSNSDSPGRRSDLNEVSGLLRKKKNLMVLITGSDTCEPDVDDSGCLINRRVMKDHSDRQDQIGYLTSELNALDEALQASLNEVKVHSISVRYAEEGPSEEQAGRWQESGLADFADDISQIARSQGLALKRQTPLKNLQTFCSELTQSICLLEMKVAEAHAGIAASRKELQAKLDAMLATLRQELPNEVEKLAHRHAMNDKDFSEASWNLFDQRFSTFSNELCTSIGQSFEAVTLGAQSLGPVGKPLPGFSERSEKVNFTSHRNESFGKAGGAGLGAWGGAEAGALLGSFIPGPGTVIGALLGAAIGTWLGGKAGGAAGSLLNESDELEIVVGDNRDEVSLATREHLLKYAEDRLSLLYRQLDQLCFNDISRWLQQFQGALENLNHYATQQTDEIEKELIHGIA